MQGDESKQVQNYLLRIIINQLERTLGKGTFGKVKLGLHVQIEEQVAIKILEKNKIETSADVTRVRRELMILRKLRHPNIIQLYEILQSDENLYLVMEYARGGELFDYIVKKTRLSESVAAKFLLQLLNAVEYMHVKRVVHRDLKPENLLLDENRNIKVADFGLSNTYNEDGQLLTACGSPCYAAPEMLYGKPYQGKSSDIWSCGVILYAMVCGYLPFEHENTKKLYEKIKHDDYEKPHHLSTNALDLLQKILTKDPAKRIDFEGIRAHGFCQKIALPIMHQPGLKDPTTLKRMTEMGYNPNDVIEQLDKNKHTQVTAIYKLLYRKVRTNHQSKPVSRSLPSRGNVSQLANMHKYKLDISYTKPSQQQQQIQYMQHIQDQPLDLGQDRYKAQQQQSSTGGSASKEQIMLKRNSINTKKIQLEISQHTDNITQKLKSLQNSVQAKCQIYSRIKTQSVHEKTYFPSPEKVSVNNSRNDSKQLIQLQIFKKKNTTEAVPQTQFTEESIKHEYQPRNHSQMQKTRLNCSVDQSTKLNSPYTQYNRIIGYNNKLSGHNRPNIQVRHTSQQNNAVRVQRLLTHNFI